LSAEDVLELQRSVDQVRVDDALVDYALEIVRRTRESESLSLGVSPRGSLMLYHAAQAMAFLNGRNFCTPDDFKQLVVPVFGHRVVVKANYASAHKKSEQAEAILREILASVRVPV
jgi:MoxR-like ATPase